MDDFSPRLKREWKTFTAMQRIFCRAHHSSAGLCEDCKEIAAYAQIRLVNCPFRENKPTCAKCPVHCYRKEMRESVREIMRYAGPRMLIRHPVLTLAHILDGLRKIPQLSR